MKLWVYELKYRTWYLWWLVQPNPASIDPDAGEEPEVEEELMNDLIREVFGRGWASKCRNKMYLYCNK